MSSPDFDNQTLAVLRGRMVRYLMRSREVRQAQPRPVPVPLPAFPSSVSLPLTALSVSSPRFLVFPWPVWTRPLVLRCQPSPAPFPQITLGRATKDNQIDVDLSLEGPAWKISRKQGTSRKHVPPGFPLPSPALGLGLYGNAHG